MFNRSVGLGLRKLYWDVNVISWFTLSSARHGTFRPCGPLTPGSRQINDALVESIVAAWFKTFKLIAFTTGRL